VFWLTSLHRYGADPLLAAPAPFKTHTDGLLAELQDKETHRTGTMKIYQRMLAHPEERKYLTVDARGRVVWKEEIHGLDAIIMVPVPKAGDGWRMTKRAASA
jgi:hypothetical protein